MEPQLTAGDRVVVSRTAYELHDPRPGDVVVFDETEYVGVLAAQSATPRVWTAAEIALVQDVAERVKTAIERARAEEGLRQLNETLEEQVAARVAERDRLWTLSQDMLARADYVGMMSAVSPAWTQVLGWSEAEQNDWKVYRLKQTDSGWELAFEGEHDKLFELLKKLQSEGLTNQGG